jgi:bla regulator protein BlaR1
MPILIGIALKSLLIAGLTLALLQLMKSRSAAERSWVAHVGLFALVVMAFAPLALPSWNVETPALFGATLAKAPAPIEAATPAPVTSVAAPIVRAAPVVAAKRASRMPSLSPLAAVTAVYALPAAILLFLTFLAMARLVALQARADVLVDGHWLSALARAQRRMGFKHGTALLTSDDLESPISWGLIRPVILLNSRAVEATSEAEAIIAHELAHVARMDWLKLLLARVATALFWFNPLAWVLAREAHQLREEAADDSVLAADIADTDYAQLLVGVARHECPGLLLGAHGVAPSKNSLARRVARVLDGKLVRGPAARPFALGVLAGAVLIAAPLAALTPVPAAQAIAKPTKAGGVTSIATPTVFSVATAPEEPADLPHIIAKGVTTSVATAVAAVAPPALDRLDADPGPGPMIARSHDGAMAIIYPPDAAGHMRVVARSSHGATAIAYADADPSSGGTVWMGHHGERNTELEHAVQMRALDVTPEYLAKVRAESPALRNADLDDVIGMRVVGVTPDYIRDLAAAGLGSLTAEQLTRAAAFQLTADYVRSMSAAGFRGGFDEFIKMRAMGVTPEYVAQVGRNGTKAMSPRQLIKLRAHGIKSEMIRRDPPEPPEPPDPDDG